MKWILLLLQKKSVQFYFSTSVNSWGKKTAKQEMSSYISILVANESITTKLSVQVLHQ